MVTPSVEPSQAYNDGCRASMNFEKHDEVHYDNGDSIISDYYWAKATESGRWKFKCFSTLQERTYNGLKKVVEITISTNQYQFSDAVYTFDGNIETFEFIKITAVFEYTPPPQPPQPPQKFTVTTDISPSAAKGSSTGDGEYDKGATCTISAKSKCSPWKFDHWELAPGGRVLTPEHSFVVNENTTCIAKFSHSNSGMPFDVDGYILCNSNGDILYDGDLVTA